MIYLIVYVYLWYNDTYLHTDIYMYIYIYIYIIIHQPPFINHFNNCQGFSQKKSTHFYFAKFLMTPVKGFCLVREMQDWILKKMFQETYSCLPCSFDIQFFFAGKRQREITKNRSKTCYWKLIFVIWSYSTWARRHATHVGTCAREHARHVGTWARKLARQVGRWARKLARQVGRWACKLARHVATWVGKHARHVST